MTEIHPEKTKPNNQKSHSVHTVNVLKQQEGKNNLIYILHSAEIHVRAYHKKLKGK